MGELDEAIFRLRVTAFAKAAHLGGLRVERRALAKLLRQKDGSAAWQEVLAMDRRARGRENGLLRRLRRFWLMQVIGK